MQMRAAAVLLLLVLAACGGQAASGITVSQVADAFRESGVEIGEVSEMSADDYGLAPMADEGLRFLIPSLGDDAGGRIMRYESDEDLQRAKSYYEELGKQSALLFSHVFTRGDILVQVNGNLPQEQADMLQEALEGL